MKTVIALVFVLGHLALMGQLVWYWTDGQKFETEELFDAVLIISPMLMAYIAAMLVFVGGGPYPRGKKRSTSFVAISATIVGSFFTALAILAIQKVDGALEPEQYKKGLGIVDTIFAGYLSSLVVPMFAQTGGD